MIANVYLLDSNFIYDNKYSYIVPKHLANDVSEGVFVTVPFGKGNKRLQLLSGSFRKVIQVNMSLRRFKVLQILNR